MTKPTEPMIIRVMVFNIEDGGEGVDPAKVVEAIERADPDIVALQEAMRNAGQIAERLGWAYASARTQVISRHPILDPVGDETSVFVEIRTGEVVAVASVHQPAEPYGPELASAGGTTEEILDLEQRIRLPKVRRQLADLPGLAASGTPVVLLGDFNAPSHLDWTDQAVGTRPHITAPLEWPVSRAIEDAGFRDTWREVHPDPIAEPGLTWWADRPPTGGYEPGPDTPNDRIDFLYVAGPAETLDCRLVGEVGARDVALTIDPWPSDHRAVVADLRVVPVAMPVAGVRGVVALATDAIQAANPTPGSVRLEATGTVAVGDPIQVRWSGGPGLRWDWIALFRSPVMTTGDTHLIWRHTGARPSGSLSLDAEAAIVDQSSIGGRWPLPAGPYRVAYLLDDSPVAAAWADVRIVDAAD